MTIWLTLVFTIAAVWIAWEVNEWVDEEEPWCPWEDKDEC